MKLSLFLKCLCLIFCIVPATFSSTTNSLHQELEKALQTLNLTDQAEWRTVKKAYAGFQKQMTKIDEKDPAITNSYNLLSQHKDMLPLQRNISSPAQTRRAKASVAIFETETSPFAKHTVFETVFRKPLQTIEEALSLLDLRGYYSEYSLQEKYEAALNKAEEDYRLAVSRITNNTAEDTQSSDQNYFLNAYKKEHDTILLRIHEAYNILFNNLKQQQRIAQIKEALIVLEMDPGIYIWLPEPDADIIAADIKTQFDRLTNQYDSECLDEKEYSSMKAAYEFLNTVYPIDDYKEKKARDIATALEIFGLSTLPDNIKQIDPIYNNLSRNAREPAYIRKIDKAYYDLERAISNK